MAAERLKTWSALSHLRRMPTEYEVVTHRLHYHTEMPFELDPNAPVVSWYKKYRDDMALVVPDWNGFRDPRAMVYRKYTESQDDRETFVDVLYEEVDQLHLGEEWLRYLTQYLGTLRFLGHGMQMLNAYQAQLAPSSYITNCLIFAAGDEMRKVQRIAYHQAVLRKVYPQFKWDQDRGIWESSAMFQPLREVIEKLLVTYEWDASWYAVHRVVKPLIDRLWLVNWGTVARINEDSLLSDILSNLYLDTLRHSEWAESLESYVLTQNPANQARLDEIRHTWESRTWAAIDALAPLFQEAPQTIDFDIVRADLRQLAVPR